MKQFKKSGLEPLSRAELSKIKGGTVDCPTADAACHPNCTSFTLYYPAFASCVSHTAGCSPLSGWYDICGHY